jgi:hypothetical protein
VREPDSASLDFTTAFSLEVWSRPTSQGLAQTLFRKNNAYMLKWNNTDVIFVRWTGGAFPNAVTYTPSPGWSANTTYYLAATYDGANLKLYIDGNLVSTVAGTGTVDTTATDLMIGSNQGTSEYLTGSADEPAVYNKALTPEQVKLHYEAGLDAPR